MNRVMDLCTGLGGFSLALKYLIGGHRTVCYVEWDKWCQGHIRRRIRDGILDDAPIFSDLRNFDGKPWRGAVDTITAGFPCQPFSAAGKQLGEDDSRNLWSDVWRVICEVRAENVLLENVPALLSSGYFGRVLGDLATSGYHVRWDCIPASAVGANHQRDRLWIYADNPCGEVPDADEQRLQGAAPARNPGAEGTDPKQHSARQDWWLVEPDVGRVAHGVSARVDRLRALGNSIVPLVAARAWQELLTPVQIHR